ncbi:PREDICTED: myosin IB heavy chain isoform X2 [Camelina sativa]|uniref:Myosin IB heavy chain isoform X2 n=1 Tax=Camelina sativa TaxID=90675 RepID=A0ABM0ULF7_CAMSA|nr:PREDICTED: myosin IB heavy chain isoform X2 [Camelina sativa]
MDRSKVQRRPKYDGDESPPPDFDGGDEDHGAGDVDGGDQTPFAGGKVRRKASRFREHRGDYLHVSTRPGLMRILEKQGDTSILFADKVLKFTGSGKMKRRIFILTDFAIYLIDPETEAMTRRIALAAVEKMCLSKLSDNFFAIIIPTEYDLFMASTRKTELVQVMVDVTKSASDYELEVLLSNRFEYNASASLVKEVSFQESEGGIKTKFLWK